MSAYDEHEFDGAPLMTTEYHEGARVRHLWFPEMTGEVRKRNQTGTYRVEWDRTHGTGNGNYTSKELTAI